MNEGHPMLTDPTFEQMHALGLKGMPRPGAT